MNTAAAEGFARNREIKNQVDAGERYGFLTVMETDLRRAPTTSQIRAGSLGTRAVLCQCDCGGQRLVTITLLVREKVKSCVGCPLTAPAGVSKHPLYVLHKNMMRRCSDPRDHAFRHYGGRGIKVHAGWHNVADFFAWVEENLGACPEGYSFDRIDNDGHYEPGNVRWADGSTQARNRRRGRKPFKIK